MIYDQRFGPSPSGIPATLRDSVCFGDSGAKPTKGPGNQRMRTQSHYTAGERGSLVHPSVSRAPPSGVFKLSHISLPFPPFLTLFTRAPWICPGEDLSLPPEPLYRPSSRSLCHPPPLSQPYRVSSPSPGSLPSCRTTLFTSSPAQIGVSTTPALHHLRPVEAFDHYLPSHSNSLFPFPPNLICRSSVPPPSSPPTPSLQPPRRVAHHPPPTSPSPSPPTSR